MDVDSLIYGFCIDHSKTIIEKKYPTLGEIQYFYDILCDHDALDDLNYVTSIKELKKLRPDLVDINIPETIYSYLSAPFYMEGVPANLIKECFLIFDKYKCISYVPFKLSAKTKELLTHFGYLKNGVCLFDIMTAFVGGLYKPNFNITGITIRDGGYEVCVKEGEFVYVPLNIMSKYAVGKWFVQDGQLYLKEGMPYGPKR